MLKALLVQRHASRIQIRRPLLDYHGPGLGNFGKALIPFVI
jgi:hypothetical protein